jgi:N-acetylglucosamine-6-phosphate deacetylase
MDDALRAAKDYGASVARYKKTGKGMPPRRDLELDALLEIVNGERWVHCHSYRQDEILALIRTLDRHNITIGSFQHILEGYKVADEMAEHGAMASAFADWWAYKYEVKDAIPFAGALMHRAGVVVSFNSDDGELGRHLNQEAAKAVRYGGVSEVEALKFVTLNPARQLRIEERVGSIEVGKDADLVLWTKHPLSNLSTVKQTWVDGRKYFDRQNDLEQQKRNREMRLALIQKILESGEEMQEKTKSNSDPAKLWPRHDEFCHGHGHDHGE